MWHCAGIGGWDRVYYWWPDGQYIGRQLTDISVDYRPIANRLTLILREKKGYPSLHLDLPSKSCLWSPPCVKGFFCGQTLALLLIRKMKERMLRRESYKMKSKEERKWKMLTVMKKRKGIFFLLSSVWAYIKKAD